MLRAGNRPTLLVNRVTKQNTQGVAKLTSAKNGFYEIDAFYADGRVRTRGGDVWKVRKCTTNEADYIVDEAVSR